MPQADGTILIDTEINADGMKVGSKEVEAAMQRMAGKVGDIGAKAKSALNKQIASISKMNIAFADQAKKVNNLEKQIEEFENQDVPTEEYAALEKELAKLGNEYDKLAEKENRFLSTGGKTNSTAYKRMEYDLDALDKKQDAVIANMQRMQASGEATTSGINTEAGQKAVKNLQIERAKLNSMAADMKSSYATLKETVNGYTASLMSAGQYTGFLESAMNGLKTAAHAPVSMFQRLGAEIKKFPGKAGASAVNLMRSALVRFGNVVKSVFANLAKLTGRSILSGLKKISAGIFGLNKSTNKSTMGFGNMLGTSLLLGTAFKALSAATGAVKDGFANLAQYSGSTNNSISMIWSSLERLKNSLAAAFSPILTVVAPILSRFIDMISTAANYVNMFFSYLTGKITYTRAVAVQKDYAASLQDTSQAASDVADETERAAEAAEGYLSPIDEINKIGAQNNIANTSPGSGGGGAGGTGSAGSGPLFEEAPILDSIKGIAQKIKDLIKSEDFEGLGEFLADGINKGLAKIKKAISWENIGPQITYFVDAFARTFNSLVDALDWDLLGRTIGEGINTIVNTLNLLITSIDWKNLGTKIAEGVNGLVDEIDFWNLGTLIGNKLMILPEMLLGFASELDWSLLGDQIAIGFNGMVSAIDLSTVAEALALTLSGIFQAAIDFSSTFDWSALGTNIYQGINTFFSTMDWAAVGQGLSDFIKGLLDTLIVTIQGVDWSGVVEAVKITLANVDWIGIAERIAELLGYALGAIVGMLAKLIGDAIGAAAEGAKQYFQNKIEEAGGNVVLGILSGIKDGILGIGKWIYEHVFSPFIEGFKNAFGIKSPSTVMQEMGHFIVEGLLNGVVDFIDRIKNKFDDIKELIVGKIGDAKEGAVRLASDMSERLGSIVEDIKERFQMGFQSLVDLVRSPLNSIIDFLNRIIGAAQNAWNTIADFLSFSIDIPWPISELTGWGSFSLSVPRIDGNFSLPYLASGAVIPPNSPFMAVLGDQNRGTNIEAPLETIKQAVRDVVGENIGGVYHVSADVSGRTLLDIVIDEAELRQRRNGSNPFMLA